METRKDTPNGESPHNGHNGHSTTSPPRNDEALPPTPTTPNSWARRGGSTPRPSGLGIKEGEGREEKRECRREESFCHFINSI